MAKLTAISAFNISDLDWNTLIRDQTDFEFLDNTYEVFNGITYQDVLEIEYYSDGYTSAAFGGNGITLNSSFTAVTGGTITGYSEGYYSGSTFNPFFFIEGISVSAVSVFNAATTASTSDDFAVVRQALSGNDKFFMSSGSDNMRGFAGHDRLVGKAGDDTLSGDAGRDRILGGSGNDKLYGGAGNDRVFGNKGADWLEGNAGRDRLVGGGGSDVLEGGRGNDVLIGGPGQDTFFFHSSNEGNDTIQKFNHRKDTVWITIPGSDVATVSVSHSAGDTVIEYGTGGEITLEDVILSQSQIDFVLF